MKANTMLALATLALLATAAGPGQGQVSPNKDAKVLTREELDARNAAAIKSFEERREVLKKHPSQGPWLSQQAALKSIEFNARIEQYVDGTILYSRPIEKEYAGALDKAKNGIFRHVDRKDQVTDGTIYEGRLYQVMQARGGSATWAGAVGKEVVVTAQVGGEMRFAVGLKVKK